jgi:signal peptidase I
MIERLAWTMLAIGAAAMLALVAGPRLLEYRTLTMLTDSMAPAIERGDLVVVVPVDPHTLTAGDVITYHAPLPGRPVVTHRIEQVQRGGDRPVLRTRGDANRAGDPWLVRLDGGPAWRMQAVVPRAGWAIMYLRAVPSWLGTLLLPLLLLALGAWRVLRAPAATADELRERRGLLEQLVLADSDEPLDQPELAGIGEGPQLSRSA